MKIFAYVNSKLVYTKRHIRTELNSPYQDILKQKCKLEHKVFQNSLALATQSPDEFANHLTKKPGHMAVIAGEVVHIVKCVPIEVKYSQAEECNLELHITLKNESHFISPRTHLLLSKGTQMNCNPFLPQMYLRGDAWYKSYIFSDSRNVLSSRCR